MHPVGLRRHAAGLRPQPPGPSTDLLGRAGCTPALPSVRRVRLSSRRPDDADVIRARLRALLEDRAGAAGWLPDDDLLHDDLTGDDLTGDDLLGGKAAAPTLRGAAPDDDEEERDPPADVGRHR